MKCYGTNISWLHVPRSLTKRARDGLMRDLLGTARSPACTDRGSGLTLRAAASCHSALEAERSGAHKAGDAS